MKSMTVALVSALALSPALAATEAVPYGSLLGPTLTFEELAVDDPLGTLIDGLLSLGGLQFGERFAGQELATVLAPRPGFPLEQDAFDNLQFGLPGAGLQLLAGASGANLGVYDYGDAGGKALAGIGPAAGNADNFGFGAISVRLDSAQSALGFEVREADGGDAWLALYRLDGSLIQTLTLAGLQNGFYAFARSDGSADIAGFSLYHRDSYYGMAIDNLRVGAVSAVPEPAAALLLGAGLLALALRSRQTTL